MPHSTINAVWILVYVASYGCKHRATWFYEKPQTEFYKNDEEPSMGQRGDGDVFNDLGDIERSLACVESYLTCASLVYRSFQIEEKQPIFWWCIHRFLDDPNSPIVFKELRTFLAQTAPRPYSPHMVKNTLLALQNRSYLKIANANGDRVQRPSDIRNSTQLSLQPHFFLAVEKYGTSFRQQFGAGRTISRNNLEVYGRVSEFLKDRYTPDWNGLITKLSEQGHRLTGRSKNLIVQSLKGYTNQWIVINFLWAQYLKEQLGREAGFQRFEKIYLALNKISPVSRPNLRRVLKFLQKDVQFVYVQIERGRATYGVAESFRNTMWKFTEKSSVLFDELLQSLEKLE